MADRSASLAGPGVMLLSAAIFGYFGWMQIEYLPPVELSGRIFDSTLEISSVVFFLAALVTLKWPVPGNLLYAVTGLLGALAFLTVITLDQFVSKAQAMNPVILFLFTAWNGYGSWIGLQAVLAHKR